MRKIKNNYLINDMKKKVKNYILIRYEDLRDNYDVVLDFLHQWKFKTPIRHRLGVKIWL